MLRALNRRASAPSSLVPSAPAGPPPLGYYSTPAVPDSAWSAENFLLGAGMVIIQPSTGKLVIVYDTKKKYWFLPRGRKDYGESLEQAALREAYEESGYRVEFLPLRTPTCAPAPPHDPEAYFRANTEPIMLTLTSWRPRTGQGRRPRKAGGEYLTSWYVGQIPEDAVYEQGTGMPDEQDYTSHLCTYNEAMERVWGAEQDVVRFAWDVYSYTLKKETEEKELRLQALSRVSLQDHHST